jgi:hypothetical protein
MDIHNEPTVDGPQIAKLSRDLLWQIFALNADIDAGSKGVVNIFNADDLFRFSPLTTARHTSQVCASWRQLIIGSTSLWGNMIDLESLQQRSDTWRNEVLLRTGDSELSIKGNIMPKTQGAKEFLVLILNNHWTRISRIHLGIYNSGRRDWPENAWGALGRPAPCLRSCSIHFEHNLPHAYSSPEFLLFANRAPLLTHFQQHRTPMYFGAPWFANLISLTLNSPTTLAILLEVCTRMRSIQTLRLLFGKAAPSMEGRLHSVNLPLLTVLDITCSFNASLVFLDHITPAPGCNLHLFANAKKIPPTELVSAQRIIAKFANNYFFHRGSTSFFLRLTPKIVSAGDIPAVKFGDDPPYKEGFTISVYDLDGILTPLLPLCFATFVPAHFFRVKTLNLNFNKVDPTARPLDPLFTDFLAMTALETLELTTNSLVFINSLAGVNQPHFPRLKTLGWLPMARFRESPDKTSLIMNFLATRRNIGIPIEILDLTKWHKPSMVQIDIKKLEEVPGLRVVWREGPEGYLREYVCGSGRPEELNTKA